jgi:hypothetical protein
MTQVPWLDRIMRKNLIADIFRQFFNQTASLSILGFVGDAIKEKRADLANGTTKVGDEASTRKDFLSRYIELQENSSEIPHW